MSLMVSVVDIILYQVMISKKNLAITWVYVPVQSGIEVGRSGVK